MFTAQVANYFGIGNSRTEYGNGTWSLNVIKCKLGRYRVRIVQNRDVISNHIQPKGFIHTTQIEIAGVKKFSEGENIANDICRLLSFASMSQVVPFAFSFMGNERTDQQVRGESLSFRPVLSIRDGNLVASFLQQVWLEYRKKRNTRKLAEIIDMLTVAELPVQPLEVQLAQIFIALENMKGTYAKAEGIPFVGGYFRKVSTPPKPNPKKEPSYSIEEMLKKMLNEVGMKRSLKRLISLRNEIIHFGLSRKPFESMRNNYDDCQDIIREYLLRLLGYKGKFFIYSTACDESKEI